MCVFSDFAENTSSTWLNLKDMRCFKKKVGVKGLKTGGVKNLAAHEMGHSIGLGHTIDKNEDLMGPSLDASERKNLTCPSNLDKDALKASGADHTVSDWQLLVC